MQSTDVPGALALIPEPLPAKQQNHVQVWMEAAVCAECRSRCGAAPAFLPPLCATAAPHAPSGLTAVSNPTRTGTPPCAAVWRRRQTGVPKMRG